MFEQCPKCYLKESVISKNWHWVYKTMSRGLFINGPKPQRLAMVINSISYLALNNFDYHSIRYTNKRISANTSFILMGGYSFGNHELTVSSMTETNNLYDDVEVIVNKLTDPNNIHDAIDYLIAVSANKISRRYDVRDRVIKESPPYIGYILKDVLLSRPENTKRNCMDYTIIALVNKMYTEGTYMPPVYDNFESLLPYPDYCRLALINELILDHINIDKAQQIFEDNFICPRCSPERFFTSGELTDAQKNVILGDLF